MNGTVAKIEFLRSVEFDVADLERSVRFYEDLWGLETVARASGSVYLRGTGPEHHLLVLRQGEVRARRVNFGVRSRATIDALHGALGDAAVTQPAELNEPGGGYGFAFIDPEGREFRVIAGIEPQVTPRTRTDVPVRVSHVLFESTDPGATSAYFCGTPGFRLRDYSSRNYFLGCNADHHCFGFGASTRSVVSHVAYEMHSLDGLMHGVGRLKRAGMTLEWGVGKHGPGENVFAYFFDPDGFVIEYTGAMEQVDDATYRARTPAFWDKRTDSDEWGTAGPPSDRFRYRRPGSRPA